MEWKPVHGKRRGVIRQVNAPRVNWMASRLFAALLLVVTPLTAVAEAQHNPQQLYAVDLPPQTIAESLNQLARQTGAQFLFPFQLAQSKAARPVKGRFTLLQATQYLLHNTGLTSDLVDGVLTISPIYCQQGETICDPNNLYGHTDESTKGKRMNIKNSTKRKTLLAGLVGLFAAGGTAQVAAQGGEAATSQSAIDEIIVTATRRAESLNDTALSIAAIGGEEISRRNLSEMNDYLRAVPGVNLVDLGVSRNAVVVRGLGVDPQREGEISSPTTGVYFGDVSLAGLGILGGNSDLKMIDLERVEVLRGPQGTLFGSGSLAGTVRNIPKAPNLKNLEGNVKVSYSNTADAGSGNNKVEAVVNVPLVDDVLAVRAVAYRHDTSGYIDNIAATQLAAGGPISPSIDALGVQTAIFDIGADHLYENESDIGAAEHRGGRISALWKPNDDLSVTLHYVTQDVEQDGHPTVQINTGGYTQVILQYGDFVPAKNDGLADEISITNLVAEYDLGWANLLSSSAWLDQQGEYRTDTSSFGFGHPFVQIIQSDAEVFTQEFRLVSQLEGPLQYLFGVYYEDINYYVDNHNYSSTEETAVIWKGGDTNQDFGFNNSDAATEQLSFYGEISYQLTEKLQATVGARLYDYDKSTELFTGGFFFSWWSRHC